MLIAGSSRRLQTIAFPSPPVQTAMASAITQILGRPNACENALEIRRGYLKAMEDALRVSLLIHKDPRLLFDTWARLLPLIAQSHESDGSQPFATGIVRSRDHGSRRLAG